MQQATHNNQSTTHPPTNDVKTHVARDSVVHRIVDTIAVFSGSIAFLNINATVFVLWIAWNILAPDAWRFDRYPFSALTTGVSLEAILLSILVLLSQNKASERDKVRDKADKARQQALMQEDIELNKKESKNEQELLVLVHEVKQAQHEHREILDRMATLMEATQGKKYKVYGVEKR